MILLFLTGLVLLGVAVALLARAAALPRLRVDEQLRQIDVYGFGGAAAEGALPAGPAPTKGLSELAERVGRFTAAKVDALEPMPRKSLLAAGYYTLSPETFH